MARPWKTEAVVLRSIRFGEADRVLHLFTLERGQHLGREDEPAAVHRVGDRAADEREREQRTELDGADHPDGERRVRELVHLKRDRDERDLASEERDALAAPEEPEVPRLAERACVDREPRQRSSPARPVDLRRRLRRALEPVRHGAGH